MDEHTTVAVQTAIRTADAMDWIGAELLPVLEAAANGRPADLDGVLADARAIVAGCPIDNAVTVGPAVAGTDEWLKELRAGGVTFWVPIDQKEKGISVLSAMERRERPRDRVRRDESATSASEHGSVAGRGDEGAQPGDTARRDVWTHHMGGV